jgi:Rps23 Pro-64 3,4-dihydroxylase Tpa1-like proline 4-hydroxylase
METAAIADLILDRLVSEKEQIKKQFEQSKSGIGHFYVDQLLPESLVAQISEVFPAKEEMVRKKSLREYKYVAAQMDQYNPLLEKVIYAFQDERIVQLVGQICEIESLEPDENLYAGGISLMAEGNFLNPHLDNSHDKDRDRWRILNLLYYVTPNWEDHYGGNLEVWPNGLENEQITIYSRYNRLAVMATHNRSWHSVSPVVYQGERCCVSNYYFSKEPLREDDSFHVTSFRARPGQKVKDLILATDAKLRMGLRKIFKKGVRENPHRYKKDQD